MRAVINEFTHFTRRRYGQSRRCIRRVLMGSGFGHTNLKWASQHKVIPISSQSLICTTRWYPLRCRRPSGMRPQSLHSVALALKSKIPRGYRDSRTKDWPRYESWRLSSLTVYMQVKSHLVVEYCGWDLLFLVDKGQSILVSATTVHYQRMLLHLDGRIILQRFSLSFSHIYTPISLMIRSLNSPGHSMLNVLINSLDYWEVQIWQGDVMLTNICCYSYLVAGGSQSTLRQRNLILFLHPSPTHYVSHRTATRP